MTYVSHDKPEPAFRFLSPEEGGPDAWFPDADKMTIRAPTDEELDSIATELIPMLDEVVALAKEEEPLKYLEKFLGVSK